LISHDKKTVLYICAAAAVLSSAVLFMPLISCLCISSRKKPSDRVYSRSALNGFIISYTHSVNKGRVHDYYRCRQDILVVEKTVFVSYGAGIPEPEETAGAVFSVTDSGYEISGLNRSMKRLVMAVGVIAEHSIAIGTGEIFLKTLFAPQTSLVFEIKKVSLFSYMCTRRI